VDIDYPTGPEIIELHFAKHTNSKEKTQHTTLKCTQKKNWVKNFIKKLQEEEEN